MFVSLISVRLRFNLFWIVISGRFELKLLQILILADVIFFFN